MLLRLCLALLLMSALAACQTAPVNSEATSADANKTAADYNLRAGLGYMQQQQYQRALLKFDKALQQQPQSLEAGLGKGAALQSLSRVSEAVAAYETLVGKHPKRSEPVSAYAGLLCEQKQFGDAERLVIRAIKRGAFERADEAYLRLGHCAVRGNNFALADRYLAHAEQLTQKRGSADTISNDIALQRGWLAFQQRQYALAERCLDTYERRAPLREEAVRLGYSLAKARGDKDKQATYSQILKQNYPGAWQQLSGN